MARPARRLKIFMYFVTVFVFLWLVFVSLPNFTLYSNQMTKIIGHNGQLPQLDRPILINGIWQMPNYRNSTNSNSTSWSGMSIPKIIHQTFPTKMVYKNYLPLINSCLTLNPDWQYYLWTDSDAEALIASKYPGFLSKYLSYKDNLERADSIRYIVLHHFGGIYLDMDVECQRPFFPALSGLPAFVDQERQEQSNIFWSMPYSAMNSAMGSAPGHPFYQFMINAMSQYGKVGNAFESTGPRLLTAKYAEYCALSRKASNSAKLPPVALLESRVMSPLMDPGKDWKQTCLVTLNFRWWTVSLAGCKTLQAKNWRMDDSDNATLAVHKFLHLGYRFKAGSRKAKLDITKVFPNRVKFFNSLS
ncbi:hypothetical protein BOX15_Mlig026308g1 [Macrostomum lignano]|uniref:Uncharacterized protein n=1 Tax=Macrostomum lignano TaxID=282301 RepID=A0A267FEG6_9PLAT|nr:hypothetical protein BOX15_Mlig026308g1 [Macrostomum lignano]